MNEAEVYGANLEEIRQAIMIGDYYSTIERLHEIAKRLANENFKLRMGVEVERERYNPYLADEREEGMRL